MSTPYLSVYAVALHWGAFAVWLDHSLWNYFWFHWEDWRTQCDLSCCCGQRQCHISQCTACTSWKWMREQFIREWVCCSLHTTSHACGSTARFSCGKLIVWKAVMCAGWRRYLDCKKWQDKIKDPPYQQDWSELLSTPHRYNTALVSKMIAYNMSFFLKKSL